MAANDIRAQQGQTYNMRLVMGANGAGKTSLMQQYVDDMRAAGGKVHIIDPQDQFPGDPDAWWEGTATLDEHIASLKGKFSGLLVLDDADAYLDSTAHKGSVWRELIVGYRHWQMDVVINSRRPQDLPKQAMAASSSAAVFLTRDHLAREFYAKWWGKELLDDIPDEPFRYLLVDCNERTGEVFATRPRQQQTAADEKDV